MITDIQIIKGILTPFIGTSLGALIVLIMRSGLSLRVSRILNGFAAGVMSAASVWSLLIPSMEMCGSYGALSFIPATVGFWVGVLFLMLIDRIASGIVSERGEGEFGSTFMLVAAVVLHNIPEGLAVGVAYAALAAGEFGIGEVGAFALSLGIAIQNLPEGAIISMPLRASGASRLRSFLAGVASGIVEPIAACAALVFASYVTAVLPYLLSFAAGAMMFVVSKELIPQSAEGDSNTGAAAFALGFTVMMSLDVALG